MEQEQVRGKTQEIVLRYVAQVGRKTDAIRLFNEGLDCPVTEATFYNWCNGKYTPMPRVLKEVMRAYPAGDWRYQMAVELRDTLTGEQV